MKCPHCGCARSRVLLTRAGPEAVYRRRNCLGCFRNFVSIEEAPKGLRLPRDIEHKSSAKAPRKKPGQASFNTQHLMDFL
jgi:transcriptional regulator NrdR family protein